MAESNTAARSRGAAVPLGRWGLSLIPPLIIFFIQWASWTVIRPYAWFLFYPAIFASSWIGGLRGGISATALSGALVWWFFIPPEHSLAKEPRLLLPLAVFLAMGALIAAFHGRLHRVNAQLKQVNDERRVFAALVENSPDFIGIADASGTPVYVNPAGRRMVGLAADYPVRDTQIIDYYPPEQRAFAQDQIVKSMLEQGQWQGETYFRNWQSNAAIPVSDAHFMIRAPETNAIIGMGTITRDIQRARDLEARVASLVEQAPEGIFVADLNGRYIDVNTAGCRLLGYTRDEIIGKSIVDLPSARLWIS